jgi:glycyl-tRNA synthetase
VEFHFGGTIGDGGWGEIEGIHNRTDFDLTQHQQFSGKKLQYVDTVTSEKYVPYVIETSVGADRATLAVLANAYREEEVEGETRVVLAIKPSLAPLKCGVFPLVKKDGMPERATAIHQELRRRGIPSFYDEAGAIGRRYRRQDEAGTPFCITWTARRWRAAPSPSASATPCSRRACRRTRWRRSSGADQIRRR